MREREREFTGPMHSLLLTNLPMVGSLNQLLYDDDDDDVIICGWLVYVPVVSRFPLSAHLRSVRPRAPSIYFSFTTAHFHSY